MAYRTRCEVRFGDVDHAGIVFYPQFFIYFHEAFEQFFNDAGFAYHLLIGERNVGFPTVHIETDYKQTLRYGDSLDIEVSVSKIGHRSATFHYAGFRHRDGVHACTARITCACVDMRTMKSIPIPDDLRTLFERFAS
ncbi:MAG: acyl-CoA thioesterase [Myxococcales bacterium]|nr:acyl-CoA thioesterase [Myxococcales bacterium]